MDSRITLIRHGHAMSGNRDRLRPLSSEGRSQAKQCVRNLLMYPDIDLVISSSATRAKETAKVIVDELQISAPVIELNALYEPGAESDQHVVSDLLNTLGAVPLKIYHQHDIHGAWVRYTESAYMAIRSVIERFSPNNVLIVAHGNIINSTGLLFSNSQELNEVYFNYCEGFEIYRGKCKLMQFR